MRKQEPFKYIQVHTDTGIVIERQGIHEPDLAIHLVLVIAGDATEFEAYRKVHITSIKPDDILIYVENKFTALGVTADYIKIVGSATSRSDFEELKEACIQKLRRD